MVGDVVHQVGLRCAGIDVGLQGAQTAGIEEPGGDDGLAPAALPHAFQEHIYAHKAAAAALCHEAGTIVIAAVVGAQLLGNIHVRGAADGAVQGADGVFGINMGGIRVPEFSVAFLLFQDVQAVFVGRHIRVILIHVHGQVFPGFLSGIPGGFLGAAGGYQAQHGGHGEEFSHISHLKFHQL